MKKLFYHIRSLNLEDSRQLNSWPGFKERCPRARFLQSRERVGCGERETGDQRLERRPCQKE